MMTPRTWLKIVSIYYFGIGIVTFYFGVINSSFPSQLILLSAAIVVLLEGIHCWRE